MSGRMDPRQQFSKWLAKSGAVYWIVFHTALLAVMCVRPETSMACVYLAIIVSAVMVFHVWAYTKNSTYEKGLLALLDKTRMEMSLKGSGTSSAVTAGKKTASDGADETDAEYEDADETEGGEG